MGVTRGLTEPSKHLDLPLSMTVNKWWTILPEYCAVPVQVFGDVLSYHVTSEFYVVNVVAVAVVNVENLYMMVSTAIVSMYHFMFCYCCCHILMLLLFVRCSFIVIFLICCSRIDTVFSRSCTELLLIGWKNEQLGWLTACWLTASLPVQISCEL